MDKQLIERIAQAAYEEVMMQSLRPQDRFAVIGTCINFLARIDAERGKEAIGYDAIFNAIAKAANTFGGNISIRVGAFKEAIGGEIFLSPTIPEGMALVPIEPTEAMVLAGTNEPLVDTGKGEFDQPEDYVAVWKAMLSAAQGERK